MTFHSFWRSLRRAWIPAALLFAAALFGASVYSGRTIQPKAEATVAVRDPVTARPGYEAAQITFDAVVGSHRLAERVAARVDQPVGAVEGALSVDVIPPASGFNVSPLYSVSAELPTEVAALELVQAAVEEARGLYAELNQTSVEGISATLQSEREAAQVERADAGAALDAYTAANNAADLPQRLEAELSRVASLQIRVDEANADLAATEQTGDIRLVAPVRSRLQQFEADLGSAEAERDRLRSLEGEFTSLDQAVTKADQQLAQLDDLEQQSILSQLLPIESQVKVLDDARVQSQMIMKILVYGVAVILGLLAVTTVAYLRFLRDEDAETEETLSFALGAPVLARIPGRALEEALR